MPTEDTNFDNHLLLVMLLCHVIQALPKFQRFFIMKISASQTPTHPSYKNLKPKLNKILEGMLRMAAEQ